MQWIGKIFSNRKIGFVVLLAAAVGAVLIFGVVYSVNRAPANGEIPVLTELDETGRKIPQWASASANVTASRSPNLSKAVLSVKGLSCSSCIQEIKSALSQISGIENVLVDVSGGKAQVLYDSRAIQDSRIIAEKITQAGYPASISRELRPEEVARELAFTEERSKLYVASVGGYEIARADFETEMVAARKQYVALYGESIFQGDQGRSLEDGLVAQCIGRLIDEAVMLQEVIKARHELSPAKLEAEFAAFLKSSDLDEETLAARLVEYGFPWGYYRKKLQNQILIKDYLESKILVSAASIVDRNGLYAQWFQNAKSFAETVYYDTDIELLIQNAAAGSSCCPP